MVCQGQEYLKLGHVNVEALKCSCSTFVRMGLLCYHLVSVLHAVGSETDVTSAFHPSYHVNNFKQIYLGKTLAIVFSTRTLPVSINHHNTSRRLDTSKKRMIESSGDTKHGATCKCRSCIKWGTTRQHVVAMRALLSIKRKIRFEENLPGCCA